MSTWTHERAVLANATQRGDIKSAEEARRRLKAARAEDYIRQLVDTAPPLAPEVRARLAVLLRGGAA